VEKHCILEIRLSFQQSDQLWEIYEMSPINTVCLPNTGYSPGPWDPPEVLWGPCRILLLDDPWVFPRSSHKGSQLDGIECCVFNRVWLPACCSPHCSELVQYWAPVWAKAVPGPGLKPGLRHDHPSQQGSSEGLCELLSTGYAVVPGVCSSTHRGTVPAFLKQHSRDWVIYQRQCT
jgi:hypothetical protein